MAKLDPVQATTSKIITFFVQDSSSTTGAGLAGLTNATSSLAAAYWREGASSTTAISLSSGTLGTWSSGGFKERDSTNWPGWYELGVPNAALAAGAKSVAITLRGAANMAPVNIEIQLPAVDNQDAVRFGLSSLPSAPMMVKKNQAFTAYMFVMVSSTDHVTPVNSATVSATRCIDGGAPAATTNSPAYVATSTGIYSITFSAADLNGNNIMFLFTAAGCDSRFIQFMTQP